MPVFQEVAGSAAPLTGQAKINADINGSGAVELSDAMKIFQYAAGIINSFN